MVFTNKYSETLINILPNFEESSSFRNVVKLFCADGFVDIYNLFTALSWYIVDVLVPENDEVTPEEVEIYIFIENFAKNFSNSEDDTDEFHFVNASYVCFLENLINSAGRGRITYDRFIPFLGEKSKEFCRSWDKFTGVKTPGLWDGGYPKVR